MVRGSMAARSFARSKRFLATNIKSPVIPLARFLSTMPAAHAPSHQNGIEHKEPIRSATRLKDGRALAQDVWSIYKSVTRPLR